ncbi:DUF2332 domain-containing protein [Halobium salinum]|uniref:DUF2332 domain-containing protein n=1 Tax=Halobium salinum TaxID=1364940 RepID=A0ABD5P6T3_9EURY|nr:DUF2332 domain-containing protein [Halobium salinum]
MTPAPNPDVGSDADPHPSLAADFERFADWCVGTSPLYERLSRVVAADGDLLAVAAAVPAGKTPPNMLFAAVQFLLLRDADHRLGEYYPSVAADAGSAAPVDDDLAAAFREFVLDHEADLREVFDTHRTQTNAVRRCAALLPAFEYVSRRVDREPLALVEVGPSAGLNLVWDRYRYEYGDAGAFGDADATATVDSRVRGGSPPFPDPPEAVPEVTSRVGVDLSPLDVTDADDVAWLRALVWPEHRDRHALLRDAVEVAAADPPELVAGDALDTVPELVAEIPDDTPVCLFDTNVRYQFDESMRERYDAVVADLGTDRELHWLTGDEGVIDEEAIYLDHAAVRDGDLNWTRLATYQQHGRWVEWLAA